MVILQTEKYVLKTVVKAIFFSCEFDAASEAALIYSWMDRVQRCESTELKVGLCVNSVPVEARPPRSLGVRVSKIGKISKILQIFGGLVLGCIKTKFCKKICV